MPLKNPEKNDEDLGKNATKKIRLSIQNYFNEEYESMMDWVGGKFDPTEFNSKNIKFDSPKKRLRIALEVS